jgi:Ca-activated chloride channel family protein
MKEHPPIRRGDDVTLRCVRKSRIALLCLLLTAAAAGQLPAQDATARAMSVLEDPAAETGSLSLLGGLMTGQTREGEPRGLAELMVRVTRHLRDIPPSGVRVTLVLARIDDEPIVLTEDVPAQSLTGASAWLYQREVELPEDFLEMAATVEIVGTDMWGATLVEFGDEPLPRPFSGVVAHTTRLSPVPTAPTTRSAPVTRSVIRVLPPRQRPATGRIKFQTLPSVQGIASADFLLDGAKVAEDDRPPFTATIDLGPQPAAHQVEVVAFDRSGREMGRHAILINDDSSPFSVRIANLSDDGADGSLGIQARVSIPPTEELDRVEFYWNDELGATLQSPPFQAELTSANPGPNDFVRVVAYLTDGSSNEDAWLLSSPGPSERIDVNLVELYVVATDKSGQPVDNLSREDFIVTLKGKPQQFEGFGPAEEVPLVLGVVIDTSESMYSLMIDTKQAGAQFLLETVQDDDQAFLVDFDTQPRLAHAATDDVADLLRAFGRLEADGYTALYDAVIFSLLQLEEAEGRKALVLLTDGDDYRSEFSQKRCIEYGRDIGVPVYIIGLAGIHSGGRTYRKTDLEGITESTGGRIFYIKDVAELGGAYAQINAELRSQYLLTFSTERPLSTQELRSIKVKSAQKGLTVRAVVAGKIQQ